MCDFCDGLELDLNETHPINRKGFINCITYDNINNIFCIWHKCDDDIIHAILKLIIVLYAEENLNMPSFNLQYGLACLYMEMTEKYARPLTDMRD